MHCWQENRGVRVLRGRGGQRMLCALSLLPPPANYPPNTPAPACPAPPSPAHAHRRLARPHVGRGVSVQMRFYRPKQREGRGGRDRNEKKRSRSRPTTKKEGEGRPPTTPHKKNEEASKKVFTLASQEKSAKAAGVGEGNNPSPKKTRPSITRSLPPPRPSTHTDPQSSRT